MEGNKQAQNETNNEIRGQEAYGEGKKENINK
jgi:hypothetical protein